MKTPEAIILKTTDKFYYAVLWDYIEDFQNDETGEYDVKPASVLAYRFNLTTLDVLPDEHTVLGWDIDTITPIW